MIMLCVSLFWNIVNARYITKLKSKLLEVMNEIRASYISSPFDLTSIEDIGDYYKIKNICRIRLNILMNNVSLIYIIAYSIALNIKHVYNSIIASLWILILVLLSIYMIINIYAQHYNLKNNVDQYLNEFDNIVRRLYK